MDYFEYIQPPGLPSFNQVGYVGGSVWKGGGYTGLGESRPEWKWNVNLRYDWHSFAVGTRWDHVDGLRDQWELQFPGDFKSVRIPSYDYFSVFASYAADQGMLAGFSTTIGVENLTDEDPPLIDSGPQANTDPSQYDVFGRRYYLRMSYRF